MTFVSSPLKNSGFVSYILPSLSSPQDQKKGIIYYTNEAQEKPQSHIQRKAWSFLTMGIPAMIEAFSVFFAGITHREKSGISLVARFKGQYIRPDQLSQLNKFQRVNEGLAVSINEAERGKALQLMQRILNEAERQGTPEDVVSEKLKPFTALLEKCSRLKTSRHHFKEEDWKVLDLIDFELVQESFNNFVTVFNSDWMGESGLHTALQSDFGIDYYEAVLAETLSLFLGYIERLDGKQISLPIFDPSTGLYRSASYQIKQTYLGDALPCYILESEDPLAHPWFVVRGTQPYTGLNAEGKELRVGSLESILADSLDHDCISRNVINKALVSRPIVNVDGKFVQTESLSDIFRNWREQGKTVNLCGHSLGGTIVNALTVEFYDQVKGAYAFSGAGVSYEMAQRWESLVKNDTTESYKTKLVNFDYEGDFVPSGGKSLIGNHFAMTELEGKSALYDSHVISHLNRDFQIQKVDLTKENRKLSRFFMERVRMVVGTCFRFLLQCFNSKYIPDWWKRSKEYMAYAAFERHVRKANPNCFQAS